MEYHFTSFQILVPLLLFVFLILRIWKISKSNHSISFPNLPPGPQKLPLIGNLHLLFGGLPHHCLTELAKKYGRVMHLQLGEVPHIVVSSPEAAKEVMKIHDINFAQRPKLLATEIVGYNSTDIAFSPYGDYWRQLRKICTLELLSAKRVKSFQSIREEEVSNFIRSISSSLGSPINFTKMLFTVTNDITARAAFGRRCKDKDAFLLVVKKLMEPASGFCLADLFPSIKLLEVLSGIKSELKRLHREADKIIQKIIDDHKASRDMEKTSDDEVDDLLHVLLNVQEHGDLEFPFTTDNIKAVILDIFIAGSETSSTAAEWTMSEILKNPRVLKKAQAEVRQVFDRKGNVDEIELHELKYLKLVIKETLRLHPPVPLLLPRECIESCKIDGYYIPLEMKVIVNAWAIGRDSKYWTEPERFYPERFLESSIDYKGNHFEYIPFGAGRRMCPGISFGIANVELPLAQLLYHFNWQLPDGAKNEDLDMTEAFATTARRKHELYLIPFPYNPSSCA